MNNNWVKQPEDVDVYQRLPGAMGDTVSIGDEIEAEGTEQWGTVVGIIRDKFGRAVCYKVFCVNCFDYIQRSAITMREQCESADWSLGRIGYVWVDGHDEDDVGFFYNKATGDVIRW